MKKLLLIAFLSIFAQSGFAQALTDIGLYGGAGTSTVYNYDVGITGGLSFTKQIVRNVCIGANVFYQGYAFKYDREAYNVNNGTGNAGVTILNKSSYVFIAPKFSHFFGKLRRLEAYVNAGVGFKMSGTETMRKWDYSHGSLAGDYDSVINTSNNITSMVLRVGVGLTEHLYLNNDWWFTITEDAGFLGNTLTKTSNVDDPSRTAYSPNGRLNPNYFSITIGVSHASRKK